MWDPFAEFETAVLPNGLTIHCAHWPNRPWVYCGCVIQSGSNQDPVGKEGLAHFVEHRVGKYTTVSRNDMNSLAQMHGGRITLGETDEYRTHYRFFLPTDPLILHQALSWFGTMLFKADLSQDEIEDEREIIVREFHDRYPSARDFDRSIERRKFIYDDGALAPFHLPIGNLETIAEITTADISAFHRTHYTPANTELLCVGGLSLNEWITLLRASPLTCEKPGTRTIEPSSLLHPIPFTRHVRELSLKEENPKSGVTTGKIDLLMRLPHYAEFSVLSILQSMFQKVLFDEIRTKRNLAYAFQAGAAGRGRFCTFGFSAGGLDSETLGFFEDLIDEIIESMGQREELFEQIRHARIQSFNMTDLSANDVCITAEDQLLSFRRILTFQDRKAELEALTMDHIREVLSHFSRENRWISVIHP